MPCEKISFFTILENRRCSRKITMSSIVVLNGLLYFKFVIINTLQLEKKTKCQKIINLAK